jgi:hypothetical protein
MVADGSVDKQLVDIAGEANAQGVFATMTQTPSTIPGGEKWIADYKAKFNADPGPYSTQSYDAVRVAAEAVVSFPNFAYRTNRAAIAAGHMPVSEDLPYDWFDTPDDGTNQDGDDDDRNEQSHGESFLRWLSWDYYAKYFLYVNACACIEKRRRPRLLRERGRAGCTIRA